MRIYECADYDGISRKAADIICAQVVLKPDCVLGLATGSTPIGAYQQLIRRYRQGELSFAQVKSVNLDEYYGLAPDHDQSYRYFMQTQLFDHVDIRVEHTHVPNGQAADPQAECARYDRLLHELGGVDLQLLGIGNNGHIGFNEPGQSFLLNTHLAQLTDSTVQANKRFFNSEADVPRQALTMGIAGIMHARKVLVAASGKGKAEAIRRALCGPVDPQVPASILQLHQDVVLVGDREALSGLDREGITVCG